MEIWLRGHGAISAARYFHDMHISLSTQIFNAEIDAYISAKTFTKASSMRTLPTRVEENEINRQVQNLEGIGDILIDIQSWSLEPKVFYVEAFGTPRQIVAVPWG